MDRRKELCQLIGIMVTETIGGERDCGEKYRPLRVKPKLSKQLFPFYKCSRGNREMLIEAWCSYRDELVGRIPNALVPRVNVSSISCKIFRFNTGIRRARIDIGRSVLQLYRGYAELSGDTRHDEKVVVPIASGLQLKYSDWPFFSHDSARCIYIANEVRCVRYEMIECFKKRTPIKFSSQTCKEFGNIFSGALPMRRKTLRNLSCRLHI